MKSAKIILLLFVIFEISISAQDYKPVWENIESREFVSEQVDDTFRVYIKLPDDYNSTDQNYPVLYLLDGDITFPLALSALQYMEYGQHVAEMIIVGIGYGSLDWQTGNNRSRDYTVFSTPDRPYQGGAGNFQTFLESELLPEIESGYRVNKNRNIIFGHSLGGQFVLYSLINNPGLFSGYIASSPFILNIREYLIEQLENKMDSLRSAESNVFVSIGGKESKDRYHMPVNEIVKNLMIAAGNKERINFKVFGDADHFTVPPQALINGIIHIVNSEQWRNLQGE